MTETSSLRHTGETRRIERRAGPRGERRPRLAAHRYDTLSRVRPPVRQPSRTAGGRRVAGPLHRATGYDSRPRHPAHSGPSRLQRHGGTRPRLRRRARGKVRRAAHHRPRVRGSCVCLSRRVHRELRFSSEIERAAASSLEDIKARLIHANTAVALSLRRGVPWVEITSAAAETKADLIVMGTHGRRGMARALLGSVAEKVVRTAPCPVLTVHLPDGESPKAAAPPKG